MADDQLSDGQSGDELHWRETYFIVFPQSHRPLMEKVERALGRADGRMKLENQSATREGLIESLLIESPEDHAAVEVSYEVGDAVIEQNLEWAKQLQNHVPSKQLQKLIKSDARLDVAHFERLAPGDSSIGAAGKSRQADPASARFTDEFADEFGDNMDEPDFELLDPTCLLTVVETLASLTKGLTFDPAAGEILE